MAWAVDCGKGFGLKLRDRWGNGDGLARVGGDEMVKAEAADEGERGERGELWGSDTMFGRVCVCVGVMMDQGKSVVGFMMAGSVMG